MPKRLTAAPTIIFTLGLFGLLAPGALAAAPTVVFSGLRSVTTTSAELQAEVNPQGSSTQVRFEFGTADCESSSCTKTPNAGIGEGNAPKEAGATITGLTPGTAYHFRVVAKSVEGTANGPDTLFATYSLPPVFGACSNDAFRINPTRPSAALPDCRAYEQASPVKKNGLDARGRVSFVKASPAGDRISFVTAGGAPGAEGSQELPVYLSSRAGANWSTQGLLPPESYGEEAFVLGWLPGFSQVFDGARRLSGAGGGTFLARSSDDASIAEIVPYGAGLETESPSYAGASADGSEVIFESDQKLSGVQGALDDKSNLYLWDRAASKVTLAGVLNDKTAPPAGSFAGPYDWIGGSPVVLGTGGAAAHYYTQEGHAISADGTKIYFTAGKSGRLYLRLNPSEEQSAVSGDKCTEPSKACTVPVSASERELPDPAGERPAAFMEAIADGSVALFTSTEKLTDDANTGPEIPPASIARADVLDGSGTEISFLPAEAKGLAAAGGFLYWADPTRGAIGRAKLNGAGAATEVQKEFIADAGNPQYVAVDGAHVYWTDAGNGEKEGGRIGRADLEGTNVEPNFIGAGTSESPTNPQGIDAEGEFLYWSNAGSENATRTIGRAKLGVGGAEGVDEGFIDVGGGSSAETPQGLAVDATHIFIGTNGVQQFSFLVRFDIDGTNEKFIFDGKETEVKGVALDAGHVYWARRGVDKIGRANLNLEAPSVEKEEFITAAQHPLGLSVDAEHVYWSANQESPPNPGNDLYRFDANATGKKLSDLTVDTKDAAGAQVLGVLGSSADASLVYFAANGDLDGPGDAQPGTCKGSAPGSEFNFTGNCSLYLARAAGSPAVEFIAPLRAGGLGGSDAFNWLPRGGVEPQLQKTARVSPDGQTLLFRSQEKLGAYDNKGTPELYRYRIGTGIDCVSCNPTGLAPTGTPGFGSISLDAVLPVEVNYTLSRVLSADGNKVFFETTDALVGEDTNGTGGCPVVGPSQNPYRVCIDAYEWEAEGTGTCTVANADGGCIYLLSSGKSSDASYFADASADGQDAFLITRSQLVLQDQDRLYDIYDAKVGGGLAAQNTPPPPPCENEGCKDPAPVSPAFESPGTASFAGPPNPKPKKHKKKKKAKHHKGKGAHKKHHKAQSKGRAGR